MVNFDYGPIMTADIGKKMLDEMKKQTSSMAALASSTVKTAMGSFMDVARLADVGRAKDMLAVGDILSDKWIDKNADNKEYILDWRVVDFRDAELKDGEILKDRPVLMTKYVPPYSMQFSQYRAFKACPDGLSAGTYYITFAQAWSKLTADHLVWHFTLTQDVPAGGRIAGFRSMADWNGTDVPKIYSYTTDGMSLLETVNASEGAEGTDLGVIGYTSRNGDLNNMHEVFYGYNRYIYSAARKYILSSGLNWWKPSDQWDCIPDQASTLYGFMSGLSDDFKSAIKPFKQLTWPNNFEETAGVLDATYDLLTLPTFEDINVEPYKAGESSPLLYWKRRGESATLLPKYVARDSYKFYSVKDLSSSLYVWLRSAHVGIRCFEGYVHSSGGPHSSSARYSMGLPLIAII